MKKRGAKKKVWDLASNLAGRLIGSFVGGPPLSVPEKKEEPKRPRQQPIRSAKPPIVESPPSRQVKRRAAFKANKSQTRTASKELQRAATIKGRKAAEKEVEGIKL